MASFDGEIEMRSRPTALLHMAEVELGRTNEESEGGA